jgi:hypothetical protein
MLRNAAVDLLTFRLGSRDDLRDLIIAEMDLVISTELDRMGTYYLWQLTANYNLGTLATGDYTLDLSAAGVLGFDENSFLRAQAGSVDAPFMNLHFQDFLQEPLVSDTGTPEAWSWKTTDIMSFNCRASEPFTIFGNVYLTSASIAGTYADGTNNIENLWLKYAPDVVIGAVGERMGQNLMANEITARFNAHKVQALARCYNEDIARREQLADRATTEEGY